MSEFRRSFFSKTSEKSKNNEKNIISTSKQIETTSVIQLIKTTERPLLTDSESLQKDTNIYEKYKLLETKHENFINNIKKRNNLLMKAKEMEIKKIIPLLKKEEDFLITESGVHIKIKNMGNDEISLQRYEINLQQSYFIKKF